MKFAFAFLLALLAPQSQPPETIPPLGVIDLYGNRTVSASQIRQALPFHEGDAVTLTKFYQQQHDVEQNLTSIPGIQRAFLMLVCCTDEQKSMIYVGVEESASPCLRFNPAPTGSVRLTEDVLQAGKQFMDASQRAMEKGNFAEDDSAGHTLSQDPDLRAVQLLFIPLAQTHRANLIDIMHNSSDANQRALAAQVLGYVQDKQAVVSDLVAATRDPDPNVRNNASRALLVFARFSPQPPAAKIQVPSLPFIQLLNSCIWTDRNKSSAALAELTETRDPQLLAALRNDAFPSLTEMAQWKFLGHAWPSLMILGRIGGLTDDEIQNDLDHGHRDKVIAAAKTAAHPATVP